MKQYKKQLTISRKHQSNTKQTNNIVFFDRSMIDVIAYMNFWKEKYPSEWDDLIMNNRYEKNIFYTPNWKEIYQNTEQRPENYTKAKKIDLFLRATFLRFNYNIIEIPKTIINKRVSFILNKI